MCASCCPGPRRRPCTGITSFSAEGAVRFRPVEAAAPAPLSRRIHFGLVLVLLAGLAVQFYLAGRGAFGASTYSSHKDLGGVLHLFSLLFLIVTVALPSTRN